MHDVSRTAALRSLLDDSLVLASRFDHQPPFAQIVRARFLNIDMLAGGTREDGRRSVPMIGRGIPDGNDILVIENLPHVGDGLRSRAVREFRHFDRRCESLGIDIADMRQLHSGILEESRKVGIPHASRADECHRNFFGRSRLSDSRPGHCRKSRRTGSRRLQEVTTIRGRHGELHERGLRDPSPEFLSRETYELVLMRSA